MRHWIARIDLPSRNITPLKEVDSPEEAWDFIRRTNAENDRISKENHALKVAKDLIQFNIPDFDKEIHESLSKYIKLKIKLKQQAKESLSPEDSKTYHAPYIPNVIPKNTKLVYMASTTKQFWLHIFPETFIKQNQIKNEPEFEDPSLEANLNAGIEGTPIIDAIDLFIDFDGNELNGPPDRINFWDSL